MVLWLPYGGGNGSGMRDIEDECMLRGGPVSNPEGSAEPHSEPVSPLYTHPTELVSQGSCCRPHAQHRLSQALLPVMHSDLSPLAHSLHAQYSEHLRSWGLQTSFTRERHLLGGDRYLPTVYTPRCQKHLHIRLSGASLGLLISLSLPECCGRRFEDRKLPFTCGIVLKMTLEAG